MQMSVAASVNAHEEIAAATFPRIRLFAVPRVAQSEPQQDVDATWQVCAPATVPGFSAALYFFGRELHRDLDVPFGLIATSWGGTRIEPWTPPAGFAAVPELKNIHDRVVLATPSSAPHKAELKQALDTIGGWLGQARKALAEERFPPSMPTVPAGVLPLLGHGSPTCLYNAMVHPLIPFAMRGVIWYQGEANRGDGMFYTHKMRALIGGWRTLWAQGDFPFYFVQLAPYRYGGDPLKLAEIWVGQQNALSMPNSGMAVTNDIGNVKDIHPKNKQEVGRRLALWALAKTYGREGLVYSGPLYSAMRVEGSRLRLSFEHVGSGLTTRDGKALTWFEIHDRRGDGFIEAQAEIDGNTVVVSSPQAPEPVAARFAWHQEAEPNLMNQEGLPAPAFLAGKAPVRVNLALNMPFECSDPNRYGESWRKGLTDGSWAADALHCFATSSGAEFPKHVTIDLQTVQSVNKVVFGAPGFGSTKTVKVALSTDGKQYTDMGTVEFTLGKAEKKTVGCGDVETRFVRLVYVANHQQQLTYDPNFAFTPEVEVYGPAE